MILPINYFSVPEEHWRQDPDFKSRVLAEWEKIPRYEKLAFLKDIESLPPHPAPKHTRLPQNSDTECHFPRYLM